MTTTSNPPFTKRQRKRPIRIRTRPMSSMERLTTKTRKKSLASTTTKRNHEADHRWDSATRRRATTDGFHSVVDESPTSGVVRGLEGEPTPEGGIDTIEPAFYTVGSPMAMGKRRRHANQPSMWVATQELPRVRI